MRQVPGRGFPPPLWPVPLLRAKLHLTPGGFEPHSTGRGRNAPTEQMGKLRLHRAEVWDSAVEGPFKVLLLNSDLEFSSPLL